MDQSPHSQHLEIIQELLQENNKFTWKLEVFGRVQQLTGRTATHTLYIYEGCTDDEITCVSSTKKGLILYVSDPEFLTKLIAWIATMG